MSDTSKKNISWLKDKKARALQNKDAWETVRALDHALAVCEGHKDQLKKELEELEELEKVEELKDDWEEDGFTTFNTTDLDEALKAIQQMSTETQEGCKKATEQMDAFIEEWNWREEKRKTPTPELEMPITDETDTEQIPNDWTKVTADDSAGDEMRNDESDSDSLETLASRKVVKDVNHPAHHQIHHTACPHEDYKEHSKQRRNGQEKRRASMKICMMRAKRTIKEINDEYWHVKKDKPEQFTMEFEKRIKEEIQEDHAERLESANFTRKWSKIAEEAVMLAEVMKKGWDIENEDISEEEEGENEQFAQTSTLMDIEEEDEEESIPDTEEQCKEWDEGTLGKDEAREEEIWQEIQQLTGKIQGLEDLHHCYQQRIARRLGNVATPGHPRHHELQYRSCSWMSYVVHQSEKEANGVYPQRKYRVYWVKKIRDGDMDNVERVQGPRWQDIVRKQRAIALN